MAKLYSQIEFTYSLKMHFLLAGLAFGYIKKYENWANGILKSLSFPTLLFALKSFLNYFPYHRALLFQLL